MRNLGKTIDRILKVEPALESQLIPIKNRWERYPTKNVQYWNKVLEVLNTEVSSEHPKREEIQNILNPKRKKIPKNLYTFEPMTPAETVVGVIPESLEGRLRKYDRMHIDLAKQSVEARLTHNGELLLSLARRAEILEIKQKQVWTELKDHFNLWNADGPVTFLVRLKDNLLVLTAVKAPTPQQNVTPPPNMPGPDAMPESFILRLDPDMLKKFFKYFNITPPPGLFSE